MSNKILPVAMCMALFAGYSAAADETTLKEQGDKVNYSIGYQIGSDFRRQGVDIDPGIVLKGVEDALSGDEPLLKPDEMHATLAELQRRVKAEQQKGQQNTGAQNLARAEAFLAENAQQAGVETLSSGLQYKVMASGKGASPAASDTVTVHYRGTLLDGSEFDSSYSRNQPATFAVNRVIAGWTEALQLMQVGDKWQLFIPPELAYGERGFGNKIPANSALIFEVELLSVN